MNTLLLAVLAVPMLAPDELVELDLSQPENVAAYEGVQIGPAGLEVAPEPGRWVEVYKGKPSFGFITGVFWLREKLFFLDSPLPAGSDGGDVYTWDPKLNAKKVTEVQEQGIVAMRGNAGKIYIPGSDAIESWDKGNFYQSSDAGQTWKKFRTIPNAVHIWDMAFWRGKLYVSTGSFKNKQGYGGVLQSSDDGKTWKESLAAYPPDRSKQFARCYSLIPLPDGLYASFAVMENDPKKPGPKTSFDFYKFDGTRWSALKLFEETPRTPYYGLRHREFGKYSFIGHRNGGSLLKDGQVTSLPGLENQTVYDFERLGDDLFCAVATDQTTKASTVHLGSFGAMVAGEGAFSPAFPLPAGTEGLSLKSAYGRLFVGAKATDGGRLLAESNRTMGLAVTRTVQITNLGRLKISWTGDQPQGTTLQFQVHAARSEADLERMTSWGRTTDTPSAKELEVRGLPRGEIWVQVRAVMRTTQALRGPSIRKLRMETDR